MKKLILFLFLSTSLFCFGQGKSALKDIQSIKFYGVDYSQVKVFGADESPAQFKDAFRRINELFITEAKKYNVGKQLKKEVTEISLDAVTYEVVFFNTETKEIIEEWITDGKARGFGLRNYWAGSIYSALKKL